MKRYKKSEDRNQLSLMPLCLDDMISQDAEVRALEVIIDKMDVRSLGFTHCETKQQAGCRMIRLICSNFTLTAISTEYVRPER